MRRISKFFEAKVYIYTTIVLLVWSCPVFADTVEDSTGSVLGDFLMTLLKIALSALSILVSILTMKAITYFEKKVKIDVPAATEKMLFDLADQAIGLAHEKAHQVLQDEGKVLGGNEKLNIALQFVMEIAAKHNLEGVAENKIKDYINAKLGVKRMDTVPIDSDTVVIAK